MVSAGPAPPARGVRGEASLSYQPPLSSPSQNMLVPQLPRLQRPVEAQVGLHLQTNFWRQESLSESHSFEESGLHFTLTEMGSPWDLPSVHEEAALLPCIGLSPPLHENDSEFRLIALMLNSIFVICKTRH